mmetsp:Transcript_10526/g.29592  ORF Transcript_10526/g.29592 Transcript_10526/m.29592 type:complete len:206 (+) Transcript_10526:1199-1816(+)
MLLEDAFLSFLDVVHFKANELLVVVFLIHSVQTELQILVLAGCNATDEVANVGWLFSIEAFENEPLLVVEANIDLVGKDAGQNNNLFATLCREGGNSIKGGKSAFPSVAIFVGANPRPREWCEDTPSADDVRRVGVELIVDRTKIAKRCQLMPEGHRFAVPQDLNVQNMPDATPREEMTLADSLIRSDRRQRYSAILSDLHSVHL